MPALVALLQSSLARQWFAGPAGQAVLDSEQTVVADALAAHPVIGLPWLWLAPVPGREAGYGHGLRLISVGDGCEGTIRCGLPWPIASESLGAIVLQHVVEDGGSAELFEECARILVPGGRLALLGLNPHSPYRLRWRRAGLRAIDLNGLRRNLADAGLSAEAVAQGVGPQWSMVASPSLQSGPGLRAACLQRAEKRVMPLTPTRQQTNQRFVEVVGMVS